MSRVLIISMSDLARDPRVDRQIAFLRPAYEVVAAGLGPPTDPSVRFVDLSLRLQPGPAEIMRQSRSLTRLIAKRHEAVYWRHPLNRAALERLADTQADIVIANDLSALPLACRVAGAAPVIFDAHEFAIEEHADRAWWKALMAPYVDALLRGYLPRIAGMMTVAPGIAELYEKTYGAKSVVVTNAPPAAALEPSPVGSPIRLIHHGHAHPQRSIELTIEATDLLDDRFELDLMLMPNGSRYFGRIERLVAERPRVRLVEPVPTREIVRTCNEYDVGVFLLPPSNENMRLVLPNKLFEFIQARLAVVIGPSPEMARIVRESGCGLVAQDFTPEGLATELRDLTPERIAHYKRQADRAASYLNAESNRDTVLRLVEHALAG